MTATIAIPLQPLLEQITNCIGLEKPVYVIDDFTSNKVSVRIKLKNGQQTCVFNGGGAGSLRKASEKAAENAIHGLMDLYDVVVDDFTADRIRNYRRCATLFRMKRRQLRVTTGHGTAPANESILDYGSHLPVYTIAIDYKAYLKIVLARTGAAMTPIVTVEFSGEQYFAWTVVTFYPSKDLPECIFGDVRPEPEAAEQSVAKKVTYLLFYNYNFNIVDANSGRHSIKCALSILEKEKTLTEEVCKQQTAVQGEVLSAVTEDQCVTPDGKEASIPAQIAVPRPPKKRMSRPSFGAPSTFSTGSRKVMRSIPGELETIFKRRKIG